MIYIELLTLNNVGPFLSVGLSGVGVVAYKHDNEKNGYVEGGRSGL